MIGRFRLCAILLTALALSLGAGLLGGLYPSWRIATLHPAVYVRQA